MSGVTGGSRHYSLALTDVPQRFVSHVTSARHCNCCSTAALATQRPWPSTSLSLRECLSGIHVLCIYFPIDYKQNPSADPLQTPRPGSKKTWDHYRLKYVLRNTGLAPPTNSATFAGKPRLIYEKLCVLKFLGYSPMLSPRQA